MKKFEEFNGGSTYQPIKTIGDEQGMTKSQLSDMSENLNSIIDNLENMGEDLPAWVQDKISVSNQNLKDVMSWYNSTNESKKKGLWDNIHAKRKRGEKKAKPGDKDYPNEKSWKKLTKKEEKK